MSFSFLSPFCYPILNQTLKRKGREINSHDLLYLFGKLTEANQRNDHIDKGSMRGNVWLPNCDFHRTLFV